MSARQLSGSPEELCRDWPTSATAPATSTAMLELFDPAVEVFVAPPNFESGTYRGHEEYRALLERWGVSWDEMRMEPQRPEPPRATGCSRRGVHRAAARGPRWR